MIGIEGFDKNSNNPLSASFKYDALGRRIEKTINGETTQYLYDGLEIVQEIKDGMVYANYIRTLNIDEPLARIKSDGTIRYYHADALGSIIALTNDLGTIRTQYNYSPFGEAEIVGEPSDNPFQYTGRENDGTGLYYYRFRYYAPYLKRFISEDPIGLLGGLNYYNYVNNSPLIYLDPLGLSNFEKFLENLRDYSTIAAIGTAYTGNVLATTVFTGISLGAEAIRIGFYSKHPYIDTTKTVIEMVPVVKDPVLDAGKNIVIDKAIENYLKTNKNNTNYHDPYGVPSSNRILRCHARE